MIIEYCLSNEITKRFKKFFTDLLVEKRVYPKHDERNRISPIIEANPLPEISLFDRQRICRQLSRMKSDFMKGQIRQ